ncbi:MAG: hypothetical protein JXM79_09740 [Sedimentisphaerales bacterium]|nr:hypothetical protein [Sedimentisphaerales bacterium]
MRARNVARKYISPHPLRRLLGLGFFIFFYIYLAFVIDLRLLYHGGGLLDNFPTFYTGWDFFEGFLTYPGGCVEYLSAFLAQSFYYSWLGSAVVIAQAWTIYFCTDYIIKMFGVSQLRGLRYFGPLLLLFLYSQYTFHFQTIMGLTVALAGFCIYLRFAPGSTLKVSLFFLVIFTFLYLMAGGSAFIFVLLCGLSEVLLRRRWFSGLVMLVSGAAIPFVLGYMMYDIRFLDAYSRLLPFSWQLLSRQSGRTLLPVVYALYLFLPLVLVIFGIWRLFFDKHTLSKGWMNDNALSLIRRMFVLVGIVIVTSLLSYNSELKRSLRIDYYSRHKMWDKIIEIGRESPYQYFVCHAVNHALYRTGRLGDEMFSFPQHPTALFLTREGTDPVWQKFDTCLELGLVNQAENALSISVETFGERPLLLQRLALVNMVKGNTGTARVFLRTLEKVPFWSPVANDYLTRLENHPDLSKDSEIQSLRDVMLHTDYVGNADTLTLLMTENPHNQMAYMYGMAWLLLSKNLEGFVQKFNMYHPMNGLKIPRHFQEALLLYRFIKKQSPEVPDLSISEPIKLTFSEFSRAMQQYGQNKSVAQAALKEKFGHTYFYYYFLGS